MASSPITTHHEPLDRGMQDGKTRNWYCFCADLQFVQPGDEDLVPPRNLDVGLALRLDVGVVP
jgi:hypothetical protein